MALRVPPGVSLWFYTVADLDALIAAAVEARTWLECRLGRAVTVAAADSRQPVPDAGPAAGGGVVMTHRYARLSGRLCVTGLRWWAPGCPERPGGRRAAAPPIATAGISGPVSPG